MKLKSGLLPFAGLLTRHTLEAVQCYSCADTAFNSLETAADNINCWIPNSDTPVVTCADGTQRCGESMQFKDGWPVAVTRGCDTILTGGLEDTPGETQGTITCDNELNQYRMAFDGSYPTLDEEFASSTCRADCATDNCNSRVALGELQVCDASKNTPADSTTKWCDFTTGIWMCRSTHGGGVAIDNQACEIPTVVTVAPVDSFTPISCIQCNSETDGDSCWTKTTATACESEIYVSCTSETSITYNKETAEKLRESIVRGCSTFDASISNSFAPSSSSVGQPIHDQCTWSTNEEQDQAEFGTLKENLAGRWFDEHQLNCVLRCDPNESGSTCNVVPNGDGTDDSSSQLACATTDLVGDAAASSNSYIGAYELCAVGVTECYSEVEYLVRGMQDFTHDILNDHQDRVRIISHKRGCKPETMEVEDACVEDETFSPSAHVSGIDVKKVTCSQVCGGDACNEGNWPMRPKCLQDGQSFTNAWGAVDYVMPCESPAHSACVVQEHNIIHDGSSYARFVKDHIVASSGAISSAQSLGFTTVTRRGCVIEKSDVPNGCTTNGERDSGRMGFSERNLYFENCNFTCTDNGCNFGTGYSSSWSIIASTIAILVGLFLH